MSRRSIDTNISDLKNIFMDVARNGGKVRFNASEKPKYKSLKSLFKIVTTVLANFHNKFTEAKLFEKEFELTYELLNELAKVLMISNVCKENELNKVRSFIYSLVCESNIARFEVFLRLIGASGKNEFRSLKLQAYLQAHQDLLVDKRYGVPYAVDYKNYIQLVDPLRIKLFLNSYCLGILKETPLQNLKSKFGIQNTYEIDQGNLPKPINFDEFVIDMFRTIDQSNLKVTDYLYSVMLGINTSISSNLSFDDFLNAYKFFECKDNYLSASDKMELREQFIRQSSSIKNEDSDTKTLTINDSMNFSNFFNYCVDLGYFNYPSILDSLSAQEEELSHLCSTVLDQLGDQEVSAFVNRIYNCGSSDSIWRNGMKMHLMTLIKYKHFFEDKQLEKDPKIIGESIKPTELAIVISFRLFSYKLHLNEQEIDIQEIKLRHSLLLT